MGMYGQLNDPPLSSMSLMSVSMGVLPTRRTKKSCSITCADTVRSDGNLSSSLPKRVGWFGYWMRTYSSSAHCDFSCRLSMWAASDRPQASVTATAHLPHEYSSLDYTQTNVHLCGTCFVVLVRNANSKNYFCNTENIYMISYWYHRHHHYHHRK